MSVQSSKYFLVVMLAGALGPMPATMFGQAAAPNAAQPEGQAGAAPNTAQPQKNWKDRAEYDLFDSITKHNNPKTKLEKLQQVIETVVNAPPA